MDLPPVEAQMATSSASSVPPVVTTGSVVTVASPPTGGGLTVSAGSTGGGGGGGGGTGSPCAACKFLRRKCQPDCVFAPYFPPDNPQKFVHVHRVFGASNVGKILKDLEPYQREDAVSSLAYEADMRIRDPVYGCVGVVSILQHRLHRVNKELARASLELSKYQAAAAAAEAAAASVAVGSHGAAAPAGMTDFVGNAVANCTQNFINAGHSTTASISGAGPFMPQDNFVSVQMLARNFEGENGATARVGMNVGGASVQMLARNFEGENGAVGMNVGGASVQMLPINFEGENGAAARVGINGGGSYGFAYSPAMGVGHDVVSGPARQQIDVGQFLKPSTTGGDNQPTATQ